MLAERIVQVLEDDVVPLTRVGVAAGNKVFGAAIVAKASNELVVAGTNAETDNPLFHGEVDALNRFWALPPDRRPSPADCVFISTHEPCSMCLSAITWSGFDNFWYLFTYEDSRDAFEIPHDLRILAEVFGLSEGEYRRTNAFWTAHSIVDEIRAIDGARRDALLARVEALRAIYDELSADYQSGKADTEIPLN